MQTRYLADREIMIDAFGISGNNEDGEGWFTHFKMVKERLCLTAEGVGVVSDRDKGIDNAVTQQLPSAHQLLCTKHLKENLATGGKGTKDQIKLFGVLPYARSEEGFDTREKAFLEASLKPVTQTYYENSIKTQVKHWSDHHLPESFKREGCYANQGPEAIHSALKQLGIRDLPMVLVAEKVLQREYDLLLKWKTIYDGLSSKGQRLGKKTQAKMDASRESAKTVQKWKVVVKEEHKKADVSLRSQSDAFVHHVDISNDKKPTCSCGNWKLSGLPCAAGMAFLYDSGKDPYDFVEERLLVENQVKAIEIMLDGFSSPKHTMAGFEYTGKYALTRVA